MAPRNCAMRLSLATFLAINLLPLLTEAVKQHSEHDLDIEDQISMESADSFVPSRVAVSSSKWDSSRVLRPRMGTASSSELREAQVIKPRRKQHLMASSSSRSKRRLRLHHPRNRLRHDKSSHHRRPSKHLKAPVPTDNMMTETSDAETMVSLLPTIVKPKKQLRPPQIRNKYPLGAPPPPQKRKGGKPLPPKLRPKLVRKGLKRPPIGVVGPPPPPLRRRLRPKRKQQGPPRPRTSSVRPPRSQQQQQSAKQQQKQQQQPNDSYGAPKAPAVVQDSYGAPKAPTLQEGYGAPEAPAVQEVYGAPKAPAVQDGYGAPKAPAAQGGYGAPKAPPSATKAKGGTNKDKRASSSGFVPTAPRNNFRDNIDDVVSPQRDFEFNPRPVRPQRRHQQPGKQHLKSKNQQFRPVFKPSPTVKVQRKTLARPLDAPSLANLFPEPSNDNRDTYSLTQKASIESGLGVEEPIAPVIKQYDYAYYDDSGDDDDNIDRNTNVEADEFDVNGPNFSFPDFGMEELMDLTDIEKFFNENFFKKIPEARKSDRRSDFDDENESQMFMHGVPESGYEPTINYNNNNNQYNNNRDPFTQGNDDDLSASSWRSQNGGGVQRRRGKRSAEWGTRNTARVTARQQQYHPQQQQQQQQQQQYQQNRRSDWGPSPAMFGDYFDFDFGRVAQDDYNMPRKRPRLVDDEQAQPKEQMTKPQPKTRKTRPFKPSPQIPIAKTQNLRTRSRSTTTATSTEIEEQDPTLPPKSPLPFLDEHFDYEYADEGDFFTKSKNNRDDSVKKASLVPKKSEPSVPPQKKAAIPRRRHYDKAPPSPSIAPGFNSRRQQQRPKAPLTQQHHSFPQRQRTPISPMFATGGSAPQKRQPVLPSALPDSFTSLRASSEATLLSPSPSPPSMNRTRTRFDSRAKPPKEPPRRLRRPPTTVETLTTVSVPPKSRADDIEAAYDYVYSDDDDDVATSKNSRFDPRPTGATVVATRPHPTMPDYEYAYYYEDDGDYEYYQDLGRPIASPPPPPPVPSRQSPKVKMQSQRQDYRPMYPSSPVPVPSKSPPKNIRMRSKPTAGTSTTSFSSLPTSSYPSGPSDYPSDYVLVEERTQSSFLPTMSSTVTTTTQTTTKATTTTTTVTTTTTTTTTTKTTTTTTITTTTLAKKKTRPEPSYKYARPGDYRKPSNPDEDPCKRGLFCDVSERNYPLKTVMDIVVTEGPAVQGIYQQVIRDYPSLIASGAIWESKRRRTGSCETLEETLNPGWAKSSNGEWLAVVNTNAYPQEVKTVKCHSEGSRCSMMYSRASSRCEQKTVKRSLMVVDPSRRERGVFTAEFVIPTECACAVAKIGDVYTMRPINDDIDKSVEDRDDEIETDIPPLWRRDPLSTSRTKLGSGNKRRVLPRRKQQQHQTKPTAATVTTTATSDENSEEIVKKQNVRINKVPKRMSLNYDKKNSWQQPHNSTSNSRNIGQGNHNNTDPRHYESKRYRNPPASYPGRKRMSVPTKASFDDQGTTLTDPPSFVGHQEVKNRHRLPPTRDSDFNNDLPMKSTFEDDETEFNYPPRRKRLPPTVPTQSLFDDGPTSHNPVPELIKRPSFDNEYPGRKRLPTPGQSLFDNAENHKRLPVPIPTRSAFDDSDTSATPEITERIAQDSTIPMAYDFDKIEQPKIKRNKFNPKKTHFVTPKYNPDEFGFGRNHKKSNKFPVQDPTIGSPFNQEDDLRSFKDVIESKIESASASPEPNLSIEQMFGNPETTTKTNRRSDNNNNKRNKFLPRIPSTLRPPVTINIYTKNPEEVTKPPSGFTPSDVAPSRPPPSRVPPSVFTPSAATPTEFEPDFKGKPVKDISKTKQRVMLPPTYNRVKKEEEDVDESEPRTTRERVMPSTQPTKPTTPSPISDERKKAIRIREDRYRSQLMASTTSTVSTTTTVTTSTAATAATTTTEVPPWKQQHQSNHRPRSYSDFQASKRPGASSDYYNRMKARLREKQQEPNSQEETKPTTTTEILKTDNNNNKYDHNNNNKDNEYKNNNRFNRNFNRNNNNKYNQNNNNRFNENKDKPTFRPTMNNNNNNNRNKPSGYEPNNINKRPTSSYNKNNQFRPTSTNIQNKNNHRNTVNNKNPLNDYETNKNKNVQPFRPTTKNNNNNSDNNNNKMNKLKEFLKSGTHGNDPSKIAAMLKNFKNQESHEKEAAKDIFSKYKEQEEQAWGKEEEEGNKHKKVETSPVKVTSLIDKPYMAQSKEAIVDDEYYEDEYYEDDEYYDDEYEDDKDEEMNTLKKSGASSSSYFNKFASSNVGGNFRRPRPNDEQSEAAKAIFNKYGSPSSSNKPKRPFPRPTIAPTSTTTATTTPGSRFTPRFTTAKGGNHGFWPTARSFTPRPPKRMTPKPTTPFPPRPRRSTTTTAKPTTTTTLATTTTIKTTTTTEEEYPEYPIQTLDTSSFLLGDDDDVSYSSFDFERIPGGSNFAYDGGMSADPGSFSYFDGPSSEEDDMGNKQQSNRRMDFGMDFDQAPPAMPRLPIRQVLDIFQELKLNFGKRS